jgi:hypothetical protein
MPHSFLTSLTLEVKVKGLGSGFWARICRRRNYDTHLKKHGSPTPADDPYPIKSKSS